jgi:hypothetical protein
MAWDESESERFHLLAITPDEAPVLVTSDTEGILLSSPPSDARQRLDAPVGWPRDAAYDEDDLVVLGSQTSDDPDSPPLELWRLGEGEAPDRERVSETHGMAARIVPGSSPPWVSYWVDGQGSFLHRQGTTESIDGVDVVAVGDRFVQAVLSFGGVEVNGAGIFQSFGNQRTLACIVRVPPKIRPKRSSEPS